jgi:signal transduction histidine kinase
LSYRGLKNYKKALEYHDKLLGDPNLLEEYPEAYASYLNNRAYTLFKANLGDSKKIKSDFLTAFKMLDTLENKERLLYVCNDISEYYLSLNKLDSSYHFAEKAYNIGLDAKFFDDVLKSLKRMSEVKTGVEAKGYLDRYIKLNDSLIDEERAVRNKFARIEFETDQIKAEKDKATKERLIFLLSSVGLLITLLLLYIIITQRAKNKELAFTQQQQAANEEIYNLMLAQQDKIDEGRTQEKKRISEELHDGILGRLFGTRLSLDSLNFQSTDEAVKTRGQYIDELKSIEQEIRKISHDLNTDFISGSSFSDIIKTLIENQTAVYQLKYSYSEDGEIDWDLLTNKSKIHLYRMLQETMQNIYKHANAKHIKISFQLKNDVILLSVQDDGTGFNTNKARKGIGIKNFESRAKEIGGKVEIFSKLNQGTKVNIHVPIN